MVITLIFLKLFSEILLEPKEKLYGNASGALFVAYSRGNDYLTGRDGDEQGSRTLYGGVLLGEAEPERNTKLSSIKSEVPYTNSFHTFTLTWRPSMLFI